MSEKAKLVIIGGGAVGASVLYHLAELGWTDTILIERDEFAGELAGEEQSAIGGQRARRNRELLERLLPCDLAGNRVDRDRVAGREVGRVLVAALDAGVTAADFEFDVNELHHTHRFPRINEQQAGLRVVGRQRGVGGARRRQCCAQRACRPRALCGGGPVQGRC